MVINSSAVFTSKLLWNTCKFSHSLFPIVKLIFRSTVLVLFLLTISSFKSILNFITPVIEDFFKLINHLLIWRPVIVCIFKLIIPFSIILFESDIRLETFQCLSELISELIEDRCEFFLLIILTLTPVFRSKSINEGFVHLVYNSVQRCNGVFWNLPK